MPELYAFGKKGPVTTRGHRETHHEENRYVKLAGPSLPPPLDLNANGAAIGRAAEDAG